MPSATPSPPLQLPTSAEAHQLHVLHRGPSHAVLHKPHGMPLTGSKPNTLQALSKPLLNLPHLPHILHAPPRPFSGPVLLSLDPTPTPAPPVEYTFLAIVHASQPLPPSLHATALHTTPSTSGPLTLLQTALPHGGHGLRTHLQAADAPAVGAVARARDLRGTRVHGLYVAAVRLSAPSLRLRVAAPLAPKFARLLARARAAADVKAARDAARRLPAACTRFCALPLHAPAAVMPPRQSTEVVARAAARCLRDVFRAHVKKAEAGDGAVALPPRLLDLGTGSGALLLAPLVLAGVDAIGVGVELCERAMEVARGNVERCGMGGFARVVRGDFGKLEGVSGVDGVLDVVVSNPPYLSKWERKRDEVRLRGVPEAALVPSGGDAMAAYVAIAESLRRAGVLAPSGWVVLEVGGMRSVAEVAKVFQVAGLRVVESISDDKGFERCLVLRRESE